MVYTLLLTSALMTNVVDVSMVGKRFVPDSAHIEPGDTVRWTQKDPDQHGSQGTGNEIWYSGGLTTGKTYQHVFITPGDFVYRCNFHMNMNGKISVGSSGPTAIYRSPLEMPGTVEVKPGLGFRDLRGRSLHARQGALR
jgi:plastocyanin